MPWETQASRTKEKAFRTEVAYTCLGKGLYRITLTFKNKSHPNKSQITGFRILRNYIRIRFRFLGSWRDGSTVKSILPLKRTRVQIPVPTWGGLTACYSSCRGPRAKQAPVLTFMCPPPTQTENQFVLVFFKSAICLVPCGVNMLALTTLKDARHLKLTLDAFALSQQNDWVQALFQELLSAVSRTNGHK